MADATSLFHHGTDFLETDPVVIGMDAAAAVIIDPVKDSTNSFTLVECTDCNSILKESL